MPIDTEKVKDAFNNFVNDDHVNAKKILKGEIDKARDEFLNSKISDEDDEDSEEGYD